MRILTSLVLAGVMSAVAAPAFANTNKVDAAPTHPHATPMKKKKADKCDTAGKPCKDGEDCKLENCKAGEPAPAPAPQENH